MNKQRAMVEQEILSATDNYRELDECLARKGIKRLFLVCGRSIERLPLWEYFKTLPSRLGIEATRFSGFKPNPTYESVADGVREFRRRECDAIVAVGGGSAMDVAKCVKLYSNMAEDTDYVLQPIIPNDIPLIAVPTTAGTGSEATRFAVIYYKGEKQSVTDSSCIPFVVLLDPSVLDTLPLYQRKVTMLDALCHSIESYWSVNSTDESKEYAKNAIRMIEENMDAYLNNDPTGNANMLKAANMAGKAINVTQTTAGHAMAYKLTSLYGLAHGHAVALCVDALWPYMLNHTSLCIDPRGEAYLCGIFNELAVIIHCETPEAAACKYHDLLTSLDLERPKATESEFNTLKKSVNPVRLKNHPVRLDEGAIDCLYRRILNQAS